MVDTGHTNHPFPIQYRLMRLTLVWLAVILWAVMARLWAVCAVGWRI